MKNSERIRKLMNRIRTGPKNQPSQIVESNLSSKRTSFMTSISKDKKNISIQEVISNDKEIVSTKTSQHIEGQANKQGFPRSLNLSQSSRDDLNSRDSRRIRRLNNQRGNVISESKEYMDETSEQGNDTETKNNSKFYKTDFSDINEIKALSVSTNKKEELPNLKGDYKIKKSYASTEKNYQQLGALDYDESIRKKKSDDGFEVYNSDRSRSRKTKKRSYVEKEELNTPKKEDSLDYIVFSKLLKGSERVNYVKNKGKINSKLRPYKKQVIQPKKRKQVDNYMTGNQKTNNNYFQCNIAQAPNVYSQNANNTLDKFYKSVRKDSKDHSINSLNIMANMDFDKNYSVDNDLQRCNVRSNNSKDKNQKNDFFSMTNLDSDSREIITNINNQGNKTTYNNSKDQFFKSELDEKKKIMAKTYNLTSDKPNANSLDDKDFYKKKKVQNKMYNTDINWIKSEIKELNRSNLSSRKKQRENLVKIYDAPFDVEVDRSSRGKSDQNNSGYSDNKQYNLGPINLPIKDIRTASVENAKKDKSYVLNRSNHTSSNTQTVNTSRTKDNRYKIRGNTLLDSQNTVDLKRKGSTDKSFLKPSDFDLKFKNNKSFENTFIKKLLIDDIEDVFKVRKDMEIYKNLIKTTRSHEENSQDIENMEQIAWIVNMIQDELGVSCNLNQNIDQLCEDFLDTKDYSEFKGKILYNKLVERSLLFAFENCKNEIKKYKELHKKFNKGDYKDNENLVRCVNDYKKLKFVKEKIKQVKEQDKNIRLEILQKAIEEKKSMQKMIKVKDELSLKRQKIFRHRDFLEQKEKSLVVQERRIIVEKRELENTIKSLSKEILKGRLITFESPRDLTSQQMNKNDKKKSEQDIVDILYEEEEILKQKKQNQSYSDRENIIKKKEQELKLKKLQLYNDCRINLFADENCLEDALNELQVEWNNKSPSTTPKKEKYRNKKPYNNTFCASLSPNYNSYSCNPNISKIKKSQRKSERKRENLTENCSSSIISCPENFVKDGFGALDNSSKYSQEMYSDRRSVVKKPVLKDDSMQKIQECFIREKKKLSAITLKRDFDQKLVESEIIDKFESQKSQKIRSIVNSEENLKKETEQPIKTDRESNTHSGQVSPKPMDININYICSEENMRNLEADWLEKEEDNNIVNSTRNELVEEEKGLVKKEDIIMEEEDDDIEETITESENIAIQESEQENNTIQESERENIVTQESLRENITIQDSKKEITAIQESEKENITTQESEKENKDIQESKKENITIQDSEKEITAIQDSEKENTAIQNVAETKTQNVTSEEHEDKFGNIEESEIQNQKMINHSDNNDINQSFHITDSALTKNLSFNKSDQKLQSETLNNDENLSNINALDYTTIHNNSNIYGQQNTDNIKDSSFQKSQFPTNIIESRSDLYYQPKSNSTNLDHSNINEHDLSQNMSHNMMKDSSSALINAKNAKQNNRQLGEAEKMIRGEGSIKETIYKVDGSNDYRQVLDREDNEDDYIPIPCFANDSDVKSNENFDHFNTPDNFKDDRLKRKSVLAGEIIEDEREYCSSNLYSKRETEMNSKDPIQTLIQNSNEFTRTYKDKTSGSSKINSQVMANSQKIMNSEIANKHRTNSLTASKEMHMLARDYCDEIIENVHPNYYKEVINIFNDENKMVEGEIQKPNYFNENIFGDEKNNLVIFMGEESRNRKINSDKSVEKDHKCNIKLEKSKERLQLNIQSHRSGKNIHEPCFFKSRENSVKILEQVNEYSQKYISMFVHQYYGEIVEGLVTQNQPEGEKNVTPYDFQLNQKLDVILSTEKNTNENDTSNDKCNKTLPDESLKNDKLDTLIINNNQNFNEFREISPKNDSQYHEMDYCYEKVKEDIKNKRLLVSQEITPNPISQEMQKDDIKTEDVNTSFNNLKNEVDNVKSQASVKEDIPVDKSEDKQLLKMSEDKQSPEMSEDKESLKNVSNYQELLEAKVYLEDNVNTSKNLKSTALEPTTRRNVRENMTKKSSQTDHIQSIAYDYLQNCYDDFFNDDSMTSEKIIKVRESLTKVSGELKNTSMCQEINNLLERDVIIDQIKQRSLDRINDLVDACSEKVLENIANEKMSNMQDIKEFFDENQNDIAKEIKIQSQKKIEQYIDTFGDQIVGEVVKQTNKDPKIYESIQQSKEQSNKNFNRSIEKQKINKDIKSLSLNNQKSENNDLNLTVVMKTESTKKVIGNFQDYANLSEIPNVGNHNFSKEFDWENLQTKQTTPRNPSVNKDQNNFFENAKEIPEKDNSEKSGSKSKSKILESSSSTKLKNFAYNYYDGIKQDIDLNIETEKNNNIADLNNNNAILQSDNTQLFDETEQSRKVNEILRNQNRDQTSMSKSQCSPINSDHYIFNNEKSTSQDQIKISEKVPEVIPTKVNMDQQQDSKNDENQIKISGAFEKNDLNDLNTLEPIIQNAIEKNLIDIKEDDIELQKNRVKLPNNFTSENTQTQSIIEIEKERIKISMLETNTIDASSKDTSKYKLPINSYINLTEQDENDPEIKNAFKLKVQNDNLDTTKDRIISTDRIVGSNRSDNDIAENFDTEKVEAFYVNKNIQNKALKSRYSITNLDESQTSPENLNKENQQHERTEKNVGNAYEINFKSKLSSTEKQDLIQEQSKFRKADSDEIFENIVAQEKDIIKYTINKKSDNKGLEIFPEKVKKEIDDSYYNPKSSMKKLQMDDKIPTSSDNTGINKENSTEKKDETESNMANPTNFDQSEEATSKIDIFINKSPNDTNNLSSQKPQSEFKNAFDTENHSYINQTDSHTTNIMLESTSKNKFSNTSTTKKGSNTGKVSSLNSEVKNWGNSLSNASHLKIKSAQTNSQYKEDTNFIADTKSEDVVIEMSCDNHINDTGNINTVHKSHSLPGNEFIYKIDSNNRADGNNSERVIVNDELMNTAKFGNLGEINNANLTFNSSSGFENAKEAIDFYRKKSESQKFNSSANNILVHSKKQDSIDKEKDDIFYKKKSTEDSKVEENPDVKKSIREDPEFHLPEDTQNIQESKKDIVINIKSEDCILNKIQSNSDEANILDKDGSNSSKKISSTFNKKGLRKESIKTRSGVLTSKQCGIDAVTFGGDGVVSNSQYQSLVSHKHGSNKNDDSIVNENNITNMSNPKFKVKKLQNAQTFSLGCFRKHSEDNSEERDLGDLTKIIENSVILEKNGTNKLVVYTYYIFASTLMNQKNTKKKDDSEEIKILDKQTIKINKLKSYAYFIWVLESSKLLKKLKEKKSNSKAPMTFQCKNKLKPYYYFKAFVNYFATNKFAYYLWKIHCTKDPKITHLKSDPTVYAGSILEDKKEADFLKKQAQSEPYAEIRDSCNKHIQLEINNSIFRNLKGEWTVSIPEINLTGNETMLIQNEQQGMPKKKASLHDLHLWSSSLSNRNIKSQKNIEEPEIPDKVFEKKIAPSFNIQGNQAIQKTQKFKITKQIKDDIEIENNLNDESLVKNESKNSGNLANIVKQFRESIKSKDSNNGLSDRENYKETENVVKKAVLMKDQKAAELQQSKHSENDSNRVSKTSQELSNRDIAVTSHKTDKEIAQKVKGNKLVTYFYYLWTKTLKDQLHFEDSMRRNRKSSMRGGKSPTPEKAKKNSEQTQESIATSRNTSRQMSARRDYDKMSTIKSQKLEKMIMRSEVMLLSPDNVDKHTFENKFCRTTSNYYKNKIDLIPENNNEMTHSNLNVYDEKIKFDSQSEEKNAQGSNLFENFNKPIDEINLEKPILIEDLTKPISIKQSDDKISNKAIEKELEILGKKDAGERKEILDIERFKRKNFRLYNSMTDSNFDSKHSYDDLNRNKNQNIQSTVKIKNKLSMKRKRSIDLVQGRDSMEKEPEFKQEIPKELENSDVEVAIKFEDKLLVNKNKSFTTINEMDFEGSLPYMSSFDDKMSYDNLEQQNIQDVSKSLGKIGLERNKQFTSQSANMMTNNSDIKNNSQIFNTNSENEKKVQLSQNIGKSIQTHQPISFDQITTENIDQNALPTKIVKKTSIKELKDSKKLRVSEGKIAADNTK